MAMRCRALGLGLALLSTLGMAGSASAGRCTGSDPCYACKNCRYCKHCAKEGGMCGVCKKLHAKAGKERPLAVKRAGPKQHRPAVR